ncbi:MAG: lipoprotein-releasing ABC transporter permease subunit [Gammaproteobacteria bacterium]|nr:lipoprotein-releasing ABC transporter permease subunit [Gammaproteobacteria bacterium]
MFRPFEAFIGLRYVRAKRRNHFISFISLTSMIGVALGVTALITVLSVMNGFEKELKERILGMTSHATVIDYGGTLKDWRTIAREVSGHPDILGVAPYVSAEGMAMNNKLVQGTIINGILPEEEPKVSMVAGKMREGDFNALKAGDFNVIIGAEMARSLGVLTGDMITLVAPQANVTPAGILPRLKRFRVAGIFEIGMHEFDSALALVHMEDAQKFFRIEGATGLRLKTRDVMQAPVISREIMRQIPGSYGVVDWTQQHVNFFRALKTEKTVMFVILSLIVAVAAFNIISTLVMTVTDKEADIAVLRTLGASPRSILAIFVIQGTVIGLIGILLGVIGGVWLALNVETIVPAIESLFRVKFLSPDIYYISELPSDLHRGDVVVIATVAFLFCMTATLYPAWRAARTQPAEALRYE